MIKRWSKEEESILQEYLPILGMDELLARKLLDRTRNALVSRAISLGIKSVCIDCSASVHPLSKRCYSCSMKESHASGERISVYAAIKASRATGSFGEEYRRKLSEGTRAAWARGDLSKSGQFTKERWASGETNTEEMKVKQAAGVRAAWKRGTYDSEETHRKMMAIWTEERRRVVSERVRAAWENGDYDNVCRSPTKPETIIASVLDFMNIRYEFNSFRLKSYTYDFYLPELKTLVEYDGWYWHSRPAQIERDKAKDILAREGNYHLVRLRARKSGDLSETEIREYLGMVLKALEGEKHVPENEGYGCLQFN